MLKKKKKTLSHISLQKTKLTLIDSLLFSLYCFQLHNKNYNFFVQLRLDSLEESSYKNKKIHDAIALALPLTCPMADLGKCYLATLGLTFVICEIKGVPEILLESF